MKFSQFKKLFQNAPMLKKMKKSVNDITDDEMIKALSDGLKKQKKKPKDKKK